MIANKITYRLALILLATSITFTPVITADAAEVKIGAVNIQSVLNDSEAGIQAIEKLKVKMEKESRILKAKQDVYKKLAQDFEQQRLVSRPEVLEEKERDLIKIKRELEAYGQDTRRMFQQSQKRMTGKIMTDIRVIIKDYAKKNNYTMMVENSDTPTPFGGFVIYVDDAADITSAIIKIYNEQYKANASSKK